MTKIIYFSEKDYGIYVLTEKLSFYLVRVSIKIGPAQNLNFITVNCHFYLCDNLNQFPLTLAVKYLNRLSEFLKNLMKVKL